MPLGAITVKRPTRPSASPSTAPAAAKFIGASQGRWPFFAYSAPRELRPGSMGPRGPKEGSGALARGRFWRAGALRPKVSGYGSAESPKSATAGALSGP